MVKLRQFQQECEAWKRVLYFISEENSFLKTRLAEVIRNDGVDPGFLNTAELYQNKFMQKDEIIALMRKDVSGIDKLLSQLMYLNSQDKVATQKQKKLRREIKKLVSAFNDLKFQFNNFLAENL